MAKDRELAAVAERFWRSSRSLKIHLFFADPRWRESYLGNPDSAGTKVVAVSWLLSRRLGAAARSAAPAPEPLIPARHLKPRCQVTDVFSWPMVSEIGKYLGVLALGNQIPTRRCWRSGGAHAHK